MAAICFILCGVVALMITAIVARDAYRELRAMREWQLRIPPGGAATDGK